MSKVKRSLLLSLAESYSTVIIQIISMVILARLLSPSDIGVFSVAAAFVAIASTIRDFGVAEYLIQVKELDHERIRAALTANIAISWSVGALIFSVSTTVAHFYADPGVGEVLRVSALSFVFIPFGAVTMAYFRRELNFVPIYWASLISGLVSAVTSILLAWWGWSYMSLAWSGLAGVVATVLVAAYFRPCGFPWQLGRCQLGEVIRFGTYASGIYVLARIGKGAPDMIIGRLLSMEGVGLFSRAVGIAELFNRLVLAAAHRIFLPYFAEQTRSGQTTKESFLKALSYVTVIGWPFFLVMSVVALPVIRLIYGSQWLESAPLLQILALGFALEISFYLASEVLIAVGQVAYGARLQVNILAIQILALLITAPFGLTAAAIGYVTGTVLAMLLVVNALSRKIGLMWRDLHPVFISSGLISLVTILPTGIVMITLEVSTEQYLLPLVLAGSSSGIVWLAMLLAMHHPLGDQLLLLIRQMRAKLK
jgi:O-antigen/teichoic acid export membrane protein